MKSHKAFPFLTLLACLSLSSCYHEFPGGGGGGGGGTGTANVSLVLVSDTLPASIGIISLRLAISSVVLTSSTGTTSTLNTGNLIVDLARAQSDSIFLGTITGVPTGTNSSIAIHFTGGEIAFYNGTGVALTSPACAIGGVCVASFSASAVPTITSSQTISANTGFALDANLSNIITVSGTTLTLNLTNSGNASTNVLSSFALPHATSLAAGQLDLIEDFTGVVTLTGTGVTVASQTQAGRGSITATVNSNTEFDIGPSQLLCTTPTQGTASTCVSNNQIVSVDAILNSDGTFTAQELEPLLATPVVDTIEGTIVNIASPTQFSVVTSDIIAASSGSKIGSLSMGDLVTVNLSNNIVTGGFLVDTKGLAVGGALGNFQGGTGTGTLFVGQTVSFPVSTFTAANGTTAAIANNVNLVTLRWSRFISTLNVANTLEPGITAIPGYFGFQPAFTFNVQTFTNTNFDLPAAGLVAAGPVAIRALYLQNSTNTANPTFFAAKVRQH
jgi:hypothetical protein